MSTIDQLKQQVGCRAAEMVESDSIVGLGSGSTARYATLHIGERLRKAEISGIRAVSTSNETARIARQEGIPLITLDEACHIDVTIDGADEVAPNLDVIKGLGGFLLREKIVAYNTRHEIIVVDDSKLVNRLGEKSPVPVEVVQFGWQRTREALEATGARTTLRLLEGKPYVTDEGNYIIDCHYASIPDPAQLEIQLNAIPGAIENGLFLEMVQTVLIASSRGIDVMEG